MIDREARDRLALALRRLAAGRITNDECDDVVSEFLMRRDKVGFCDCGYDLRGGPHDRCPECGELSDPALPEIARYTWQLYSDLDTYRLKGRHALSREDRRLAARAVAFLKTDLEYSQELFTQFRTGPLGAGMWSLVLPAAVLVIGWLLWGRDVAILLTIATYLLLIGLAWAIALIQRVVHQQNNRPANSDEDVDALENRWPFNAGSELRAAMARPTYLAGPNPKR